LIALATRLLAKPSQLGATLGMQWISTMGVDILTYAVLQWVQGSSINFTPFFALPVLMAAVLGSLLMSIGAAASVTALMFSHAGWVTVQGQADSSPFFLQAALTGAGFFVIAFLARQIATRLTNVELRAERSHLAARVQRQVNELIIESLTDGVLVIDQHSMVRAANPAARQLLDAEIAVRSISFNLTLLAGWHGLDDLVRLSFSGNRPSQADVTIHHPGRGPRRVRVRTQLTATPDSTGGTMERLCVMFLQDQREIEARMRTEKMASMGRMSAAVAHEIRNPLAAISQANALLEEDLSDSRHRQLTHMVQQNVKRLAKIVEEVLDISRVQDRESTSLSATLPLIPSVKQICLDWQAQTGQVQAVQLHLSALVVDVRFDTEHLRRILVNLLDNACRYASRQTGAIQVLAGVSSMSQGLISVWSDGAVMDQSVERHLFEPFFSSESRSSGLGLYICRELCERHGAHIAYYRTKKNVHGKLREGNEFMVTFEAKHPHNGGLVPPNTNAKDSWLQTQR
jgi:two-component system sensor histidine kinase PilS (NtrC family)